jgi:hypothetical protein
MINYHNKMQDNIFKYANLVFVQHAWAVVLVFLAILLTLFYPRQYVAIDEFDYQRNAMLLSQGQLRQECSGLYSQFKVNAGEYCISKYNLGISLFYLPVVNNLQLAPIVVFIVFAAGVLAFYFTLRQLGISPVFTYLYALYPSFVYYSRTRYSETISASLLMILLCLLIWYTTKRRILVGLLIGTVVGLAVLVRYTNVIPISFILAGFLLLPTTNFGQYVRINILSYTPGLWGRFKRSLELIWLQVKGWLPVLVGGLPWLLLFGFINLHLYGSLVRSGYYYSGEEGVWVKSQATMQMVRFIGAWLILYPGMLLAAMFTKFPRKWWLLTSFAVSALFYAGFPYIFFEGRVLDLIFGMRFLIPVLPWILVLYASWLQTHVWNKRWGKIIIVFAILILAGTAVGLSVYHQKFLQERGVIWPQMVRLD